jgi:hypothetical protein
MVLFTKANFRMERRRVLGYSNGQTEISTKGSFSQIESMVEASIPGQTNENTSGSGKIAKCMVMGCLPGPMVVDMKACTIKIKSQGPGLSTGLMAAMSLAFGKMGSRKVLELYVRTTAKRKELNGKVGR